MKSTRPCTSNETTPPRLPVSSRARRASSGSPRLRRDRGRASAPTPRRRTQATNPRNNRSPG
ncbi:MAG: hypothetical protein QI223_08915, partial [Candidatus Korarchaeota archaeon]|nr:hypothetical protein [Candidatus Korarchaeota archaeon]